MRIQYVFLKSIMFRTLIIIIHRYTAACCVHEFYCFYHVRLNAGLVATHEFVYVCLFLCFFFVSNVPWETVLRVYTFSFPTTRRGEKTNNSGNSFQGVFVQATLTTRSNTIYLVRPHSIRPVFYTQIFIQLCQCYLVFG